MMRDIKLAERALPAKAFDPNVFPTHFQKGRGRMFVVTGGNAAGKLLLCWVVGLRHE